MIRAVAQAGISRAPGLGPARHGAVLECWTRGHERGCRGRGSRHLRSHLDSHGRVLLPLAQMPMGTLVIHHLVGGSQTDVKPALKPRVR